MSQRYHSCVVRTWRKFAEDDLALLGQEELNAPDAISGQGFRYLVGHRLCLFQGLIANLIRLPRLTIVATLLHVADRRAEQCWPPVLLGDGEEGELRVEIDELLDNHLLHVATTALHCLAESLLQLTVVVDVALAVATRRHQRLHHAGETNLVGSLLEFLERLGVEILGRTQAQLFRGQVADSPTVHGVVDGTSRRHHLHSLLLKLEEALGTDGLNLGHNDIGLMLLHHSLQRIAVKHGKHLALVGHLHGWRIVVAVAGDDILASPLGGNHKLFAQFA